MENKIESIQPISEQEVNLIAENNEKAVEKLQMLINYQKVVKAHQADIDAAWKVLEKAMIDNGITQLKGDYGTIYQTERISWTYEDEKLPKKFFNDNTPEVFEGFDWDSGELNQEQREFLKEKFATKSVNTKRLTDTYKLEGRAPRGAKVKKTVSITKRLK